MIFLQNENFGMTASIYSVGVKNNGISLEVVNSWKINNSLYIGAANCIYNNSGRNILQICVSNYAKNGLQIGLLNYNSNAFIRWMPLLNFSFSDKADK